MINAFSNAFTDAVVVKSDIEFFANSDTERIAMLQRTDYNHFGNAVNFEDGQKENMDTSRGSTTIQSTKSEKIGDETVVTTSTIVQDGANIPIAKKVRWLNMRQNQVLGILYGAVIEFKNSDYNTVLNNSLIINKSTAGLCK